MFFVLFQDDPTRKSSYFIYAPATSVSEQGATAAISTPEFPASKDMCFVRFWYFMHAEIADDQPDGMGQIYLYIQGETRSRTRITFLFSI